MAANMKRLSYTFIAMFLMASATHAFVPPGEAFRGAPAEDRAHFDTKAPNIVAEREFQSFKMQHGEGWTGVWNTVTKTPHRVVGQGLSVAEYVSESNIKEVTGEFIRDNTSFLGVLPQSLRHISSEHHAGRWYTDYQQMHDGIDYDFICGPGTRRGRMHRCV